MPPPTRSIHLVVRPRRLEENGVLLTVPDKLEDNPQIVTRGARPRGGEIPFQLVAAQCRVQRIFRQQLHRHRQILGCLRISPTQPARHAHKGLRRHQHPLHGLINFAMAAAPIGLARPFANSARASRTPATSSSRRRSAIRRRSVAANCSCSSSESRSAASSVLAYVVMAPTLAENPSNFNPSLSPASEP